MHHLIKLQYWSCIIRSSYNIDHVSSDQATIKRITYHLVKRH